MKKFIVTLTILFGVLTAGIGQNSVFLRQQNTHRSHVNSYRYSYQQPPQRVVVVIPKLQNRFGMNFVTPIQTRRYTSVYPLYNSTVPIVPRYTYVSDGYYFAGPDGYQYNRYYYASTGSLILEFVDVVTNHLIRSALCSPDFTPLQYRYY